MLDNNDCETILALVRRAELIGSWKVLNWIEFEWQDGMKLEDLKQVLWEATAAIEEELGADFKTQHSIIFGSVKELIEKRLQKKAAE